jgi:hypothetical protein
MVTVSRNEEFEPSKPRSRRASPRIEVLGQLNGQIVTWRVPLVVRDIGPGGFAIESEWRFPLGSTHMFRFTTERGHVVFINGRTVHTRPSPDAETGERFISGFAFQRESTRADQAIAVLLDAATSILEFE